MQCTCVEAFAFVMFLHSFIQVFPLICYPSVYTNIVYTLYKRRRRTYSILEGRESKMHRFSQYYEAKRVWHTLSVVFFNQSIKARPAVLRRDNSNSVGRPVSPHYLKMASWHLVNKMPSIQTIFLTGSLWLRMCVIEIVRQTEKAFWVLRCINLSFIIISGSVTCHNKTLCDSQTPTVSNADRENWSYEKQR